jgi:Transposase DDE domain
MSQTIRRSGKASSPRGPRRSQQRSKQRTNAEALRGMWMWLLPTTWLSGIPIHGNTLWTPTALVIQAFGWAWAESRHVTDAFNVTIEWCRALGVGPVLTTYQGFMAALVKWSPALIRDVLAVYRRHLAALKSRYWCIGPWVPIAFDGSRSSVPRTLSNEKAYCAANYGRGKTAQYRKKKTKGMRRRNNAKNRAAPPPPQIWITLLWHVGLCLPWAWRLGPSNASERDHVMDMLDGESFPRWTLFCGDAGFIGYPLWSRIQSRGHDFLVRAGANVHLLVEGLKGRLVKHGQDQLVLCWPKEAQNKGLSPLTLRLIHTRIKKTKVWLLTSVLDPKQLTLSQAVRLYQMRWGVEVEFRGLKQTLERGKLRCRNDKRAAVELDWSILGMAVVELWALKTQLDQRTTQRQAKKKAKTKAKVKEYSPGKRSLAGAMRAVRWCLRNLHDVPESGDGLTDRLGNAVTDDYQRASSKRARYRPANPDKKPLGDPKLRRLTSDQRRKLNNISPKLTR